MVRAEAFVPLAVATRSGFDESVHHGAVVCLDASGTIAYAAGDPTVMIYPRSAMKPLQAAAMVRHGLRLPPRLLAVVCASHDGTPEHLDAVAAVLASAGLDERALANTPDLPLDPECAADVLRHGGGRTSLQQNCSGKHAGMLATCVANDWPADPTYLAPEHPLQLAITGTIEELTAEAHPHIGVDGCGAPAHTVSLLGLARAFRVLAIARTEVHAAITGYPDMVGGTRRDISVFLRLVPGLLAKDGAEGVFAAALPDGRAVAVKVADGANRAWPAIGVAALARVGVDTAALAPAVEHHLLGHGQPVGLVRASLP